MRGLLKFVGVFEIVCYFIGAIIIPIFVVLFGATIFYYIVYLIFAPTIGILCLNVAKLMDDRDYMEEDIEVLQKEVKRLSNKVDRLVKINNLNETETPKVVKEINRIPKDNKFGNLIKEGSIVCFERNASVSETDTRTISKGTLGVVRKIENDKLVVSLEIDGSETFTTQPISVFSMK